jgi:H/ACA ribonucleoprotein complex subunit 4
MGELPGEEIRNRAVLVKKEEMGVFGIRPEDRPASLLVDYGIVNIDKPKGPTSHQVADYVKRILSLNKAGHSGTLDPGVTGVIPVAIGRATRIVQALLPAGKEYIALMHIHKPVDEEKVRKTFGEMTGKISQLPPIKSAVKRQLRQRKIHYVEVLEINGQEVLFRIGCEAGTYIRKYIHDFGQKIGCGAHMQELRRTRVGSFDESSLATLQDLADAYYYLNEEHKEEKIRKVVLPVEKAVELMPKVWVSDSAVSSLLHGADLKVPGIVKIHEHIGPEQQVAIMTLKDEVIGLGIAKMSSDEIMKSEKGLAVDLKSVLYQAK